MPNSTSAAVFAAAVVWSATLIPWTSSAEMRRILVKRIEFDQSELSKLWRSAVVLLCRGRLPANSAINVESFNRFFVEKVAKVQSSTSSSPPPVFHPTWRFRPFNHLPPMTSSTPFNDFWTNFRQPIQYRRQSSSRSSMWLRRSSQREHDTLQSIAGCRQFSCTAQGGVAHPYIVVKPWLNFTDVCLYVPISVLSKLLDCLFARQLRDYLAYADLLPLLQSGFRPVYSTETTVLQVLSDVLQAVDRGNSAVLVLLDLWAAFDTVDHESLLQHLRVTFGILHTAHRTSLTAIDKTLSRPRLSAVVQWISLHSNRLSLQPDTTVVNTLASLSMKIPTLVEGGQ